jgi:hypothetical protein
MPNRVDRVNRVLISLFGLAFLAAGVIGLLIGAGVFGDSAAHTPLISPQMQDYARQNSSWYWVVVGSSAAAVALLAMWWLYSQASSGRMPSVHLVENHTDGSTRLQAAALTSAVEADISRYPGVENSSVSLHHWPTAPVLRVGVSLLASADIREVRQQIETHAAVRARQATGWDQLPVHIRLRLDVAPSGKPATVARVQ